MSGRTTSTRPGAPDPEPDARTALVERLLPRADAFVDDLYERSLRDITTLQDVDARVHQLLHASIEHNVASMMHLLEHDLDPSGFDAPAAAITYACRLAQHDIPLSSLLRNYRIGLEDFIQMIMTSAAELSDGGDPRVVMVIVRQASRYIDTVSEQIVVAYEQERDRWVHRHGALLNQRVRRLLADSTTDTSDDEVALGYRLDQTHLAVVVWADDESAGDVAMADQVSRDLAEVVGATAQPLVVPADEREAWLWLPVPPEATATGAALAQVLGDGPIRAAAGSALPGVPGFRTSHDQAQRVKSLAVQSRTGRHPTMTYAEVGSIALLADDLPALRDWVQHVLGALAVDDEREGWLRETVRVFLECNGSWAAAAERLTLHRNTVQYRVNQAEELLGRPVTEGRLDLEVALAATHWLGSAVMAPAG